MTTPMKLLILSLAGFGSSTIMAQVLPDESSLQWYERLSQFGFGGLCLGLIAYMLIKTIPQLLKDHQAHIQNVVDSHAKCIEGLSCNLGEKMEHMANEIKSGNEAQLNLLRMNLHKGGQ